VAVTVYVHRFDCFCMVNGSRKLSSSFVHELCCYCPGGCGGNIPYISAYQGCHIIVDGCFWSSATHIGKMQHQTSLMLLWHPFSNWGRECFTFSFGYKGGQYFVYDSVKPVAPQITQDTWPTIVDAPLTLIFRMWWGACLCSFWAWRRPIRQKHSVPYQCQCFTINSSISECDHKCGTRNTELDIATDRVSQTRQCPLPDEY